MRAMISRGRARHPAPPDHLRDAEADGAGAQPAGDGAHRPPAGPPRVHRGDRQPALVPGADPRATSATARAFGIELSYSREEQLLGTAGGRPQRRRLPRRLLPGDLRRRPHRHRPGGDARLPRVPRRDRHPGDQAGRGHEPVRRRDHRLRRPHPGLPGEARPGRGALGPRQLRHLHVPLRDLRLLPGARERASSRPAPTTRPGFADWAMDVFPALLAGDVPFYSHEVDAYWNDIGNLDELRQGNFDALAGRGRGRSRRARGRRRRPRRRATSTGSRSRRRSWSATGSRSAPGVRIDGPAVIGDGCRIGDGVPDARVDRCSPAPSLPARRRCARRRHRSVADAPSYSRRILSVRARLRAPPAANLGVRWSSPDAIARLLVPPLCVACGRPVPAPGACSASPVRRAARRCRAACAAPAAARDRRGFLGGPHDGVARDLVVALKFRRLLPVAGLMAERIARLRRRARCRRRPLVPVPTAPLRLRCRGFDPAAEIAAALARAAGTADAELPAPRRRPAPGRPAPAELRIARPPRVSAIAPAPAPASARRRRDDHRRDPGRLRPAFASAGAERVIAVTFARRL